MKIYGTRHMGFAACLLYALGTEAWVGTTDEGNGHKLYEFRGELKTCDDLSRQFFKNDDGPGLAVSDAMALIDCMGAIRRAKPDRRIAD